MGNTPQSGGLCLKLGFGARYFQPSSYDILVVFGITYIIINIWSSQISFPTCQVRVVRFYQGALPERPRPPPRPLLLLGCPLPPRPPPRFLLLQFLLNHVCINFHLHLRLANSSPSSLPTLFADSLRQALCQLPSSVCTAGPQPGTVPAQCAPLDLNLRSICPAQCAPLDLNRGPAQVSVHCWTSTWDLPSSVCTAGPQRPNRMP